MAYVEKQYNELSDFPNFGPMVYLNERISRTGALQCLCEQDNSDLLYEINIPPNEVVTSRLCNKEENSLFGIVKM